MGSDILLVWYDAISCGRVMERRIHKKEEIFMDKFFSLFSP
jgi:hypothetical protein